MNGILEEYGISYLWYVTHIENLESILKKGILSRNSLKNRNLRFRDISDRSVQQKREEWYSYVPLFFAHNTPMLYKTIEKYDEEIILLEIDPKIMHKGGVKFADGNIAAWETNIYNDLNDLKNLDWEIIYSPYGAYYPKWKRIRSAEVLIPGKVERKFICAIHVQNNNIHNKVLGILKKRKLHLSIVQDLTQEGINREIKIDLEL